jgi:hypothetical protein
MSASIREPGNLPSILWLEPVVGVDLMMRRFPSSKRKMPFGMSISIPALARSVDAQMRSLRACRIILSCNWPPRRALA